MLLGDFNAKLGAVVSESVGDHHWSCEDTAGELARSLLTTYGLFLPATFDNWQIGSSATYHSHTGSGTRVDYVAVPLQWQNGVQEAFVSTVDLLSGDYDHSPAVLKLSLQVKPASSVTRPSRAVYNREAAIAAPALLARIVDTLPTTDAQVDADSHWQIIESHCRNQLQRRFPKGKRVLRQHYFSDATWQLLQDRKDLAIQIKNLDYEEELCELRFFFAAWKAESGHDSGPYIEISLGLVRQEKAVALWARRTLKGKFLASRKNDLLHHQATTELSFLDGVTSTSAQKLYKTLRPKRPVNRSKGFKVPKPLPTLDSEAHGRYRGRLVKVWEKHFSKIETADYYDTERYVQEARPFVQPSLMRNFELGVIPTRAEFEDAMRLLSSRKAPGYDGLGAELWKSDPSVASGRLYPLFLKSVARGYIPLQFRGGFLVPLYKNKGPADDAASYRGILLQNTAAKIFAKSWRTRLVSKFGFKFGLSAPPMLCGCMKRRGVDSAHLAVRLHQHSAHVRQQASAIIFIDIKAAYYSVVKELFYDTTEPDGLRAVTLLFHRLKLPESALEDFVSTVSGTNLLEDASVHEVLQKFVLATISHSWFQVPGSAGVCVPQTGTRPGDPLADLLFAFAMSRILEETYEELIRADCLHLHEDAPMGTTWADDTCVLLSGEATTIDARSATAFSIIHAVLQRHGLTPTYGAGKTAVLINYRGRLSARHHKQRYSMASPALPVVVEHGCSVHLNVVLHYKHLGSIVDGDTLLPEIKTRSAVALQAVKPLVKQCLANEKIGLPRRQQILASLGLSVLLHNVGTWRRLNEQEFGAWHAAVWKLYSCMYRSEPTDDFSRRTIDHVALKAGSFTPSALLHVARLRLLTNLLRAPDDLLPFAIEDNFRACGEDSSKSWFGSVMAALDWLKATVGDFPSHAVLRGLRPRELVFPHADLAQDLALALRKAKREHLLLVQMTVDLSDADHQIQTILKGAGWTCPDLQCDKEAKGKYTCPQCGAGFRGEAHLATHRQRAHGQLVAARRYVTGTTCQACKKNFHTRPRVIKHLQYQSSRCLPWLILNRDPISVDFARDLDARDAEMIGEERRTGTRSSATRMPVDDSEAVMPPVVTFLHCDPPPHVDLQGYGPLGASRSCFLERWRRAPDGPWVLDAAKWSTFAAVLKAEFDACPVSELETFKGGVCDLVEEVAWRQDDFEQVYVAQELLYDIARNYVVKQVARPSPAQLPQSRLRALEAELGSLPIWMGLRDPTTRDNIGGKWNDGSCQRIMATMEETWREEVNQWIPCITEPDRPFYRECYYLILFSGHRREGDIATQLGLLAQDDPHVKLIPVCLDLCIDETLGDLLCPVQQAKWFEMMKAGKVIGLHASPPCETYTDARWLPAPEGRSKPRPLRNYSFPWGFEALDWSELRQLRVGNVLFYVAVVYIIMALVTGGCATLEHPRGSPADTGRFRIWASSFLERVLRHPRCRLHTFCQGFLGQYSLEPTTFLLVRLECLVGFLKRASTYSGPFTELGGVDASTGEWKTARAKAFPPALCKSIAQAVLYFSGSVQTRSEGSMCLDLDRQNWPSAMTGPYDPYATTDAGLVMGPDFWRG